VSESTWKGLKEVEVNTPISLEEQAFYDKVDSNIVEQVAFVLSVPSKIMLAYICLFSG